MVGAPDRIAGKRVLPQQHAIADAGKQQTDQSEQDVGETVPQPAQQAESAEEREDEPEQAGREASKIICGRERRPRTTCAGTGGWSRVSSGS